MTDIVDDLERYARFAMPNYPNDVCSRAKIEIERLRERCEGYKGQVKFGADVIARLRAELKNGQCGGRK